MRLVAGHCRVGSGPVDESGSMEKLGFPKHDNKTILLGESPEESFCCHVLGIPISPYYRTRPLDQNQHGKEDGRRILVLVSSFAFSSGRPF